jgi:hypothetical protein
VRFAYFLMAGMHPFHRENESRQRDEQDFPRLPAVPAAADKPAFISILSAGCLLQQAPRITR